MYESNTNNNQYENHSNDPFWGERKGLAIWAVICGVGALVASFSGIFGCMLGSLAILFGIFSKGGAKVRSSKGTAGIIMGAIGFAFGAFLLVYSMIYAEAHPEMLEQWEQMIQGYSNFLDR